MGKTDPLRTIANGRYRAASFAGRKSRYGPQQLIEPAPAVAGVTDVRRLLRVPRWILTSPSAQLVGSPTKLRGGSVKLPPRN
jgi:hypothetical protein